MAKLNMPDRKKKVSNITKQIRGNIGWQLERKRGYDIRDVKDLS